MAKKEEIKVDAPKAPVEGQDFKSFEYADVFFECNRCGHMTVLDKGIQDGLQFVLPATDKHEWRMVCGNCKNMMRIFFRASSNETIAAKKAEKAKKEAEDKKAEAIQKVKENELKKKDKKTKSTKRSNKSDERETGVDSAGEGSLAFVDESGR